MTNRFIFYIFLILHGLVWAIIQLLRNVASIDAMEAVVWGELLSFGTNKHPPLSGWIMSGLYNAINSDFLIYLTGQICIITGFIFVYKLAKFFLSDEKAFCSAMILEGCTYYSFYVFVNSYNCNILLMALWPMIIYYFYKAVKFEKLRDWLLFGLTSGLAFLGKYQIVFLFIALFLYLIIASREQFKKKGMYIAILTGIAVISGHIIWLFKNDFFSFAYMLERTESQTHNLPIILVKLSHFFYPVKFIFGQIIAILGCIGLYLLFAIHSKNISVVNCQDNKSDKIFLLTVFWIPVISQGMMGLITGNRVPSMWGSIMVSLAGILLFYFFPIKFKENSFKYFTKLSYGAMAISLAVVGFYAILQNEFVISYPKVQIMTDFANIWNIKTQNSELKYVAGDFGLIFPYRIKNKQPKIILHTFGHKNPWIDYDDVHKSGLIIFAKTEPELYMYAKELDFDKKDFEPQKYSVQVCNKLNRCDNDGFVYTIIK